MYLSLNNALFLMYTLFGGIFTCAKFRHQNEIDQNISTESIAVQWDNITVTYGSRTILSIGPGRLDKGKVLGVLGASGSGKTTFLNVVAGKSARTTRVNGNIINQRNKNVAFIHQDDHFFGMMNVEETLLFSALIRAYLSDRPFEPNAMKQEAYELINKFSLDSVSGTIIGDQSLRGVSGGERKRVAIASEILGNPSLLVADEPTSGLDSFQAAKVMTLFRQVAFEKNIAVVCSIHQPRSSIWQLFDEVLLLVPGGRVAYFGERKRVLEYFDQLGFSCPLHMNPAEFLIDLVSEDTSSIEAREESHRRINSLVKSFQHSHSATMLASDHHESLIPASIGRGRTSCRGLLSGLGAKLLRSLQRFRLLLGRSMKQTFRDRATIASPLTYTLSAVRFITSGILAVVVGAVYGRQDSAFAIESISNRVNIIAQAAINVGMMSLIKTLQIFKRERYVIDRERGQGLYNAFEYLLAKFAVELPLDALMAAFFGAVLHLTTNLKSTSLSKTLALLSCACSSLGLAIGSLCPQGDVALAVGPALMVVYVIMGTIGPGGAGKEVPLIMKPFRYGSPMRWACESLCASEFRGRQFGVVENIRPPSNLRAAFSSVSGLASAIFSVCAHAVRSLHGALRADNIGTSRKDIVVPTTDGDRVLKSLGLGNSKVKEGHQILGLMVGCHTLIALVGLIASKFFST